MSEYLDTSIVVKWFKSDESMHGESLQLRERIFQLDVDFVMSEYGLLELVRALVKSGFPKKKIDICYQSVKDLFEIGALVSVPVSEVIHLAMELEIELNLYAGDAIHLASAIHYGCTVLWSADKHHLKEKTRKYLKRYAVEVRSLDN